MGHFTAYTSIYVSCKNTVRHLWRNQKRRAGDNINVKYEGGFHSLHSFFTRHGRTGRLGLLNPDDSQIHFCLLSLQVSQKDFSSSPCVQTGSGAHPASCKMGTGGSFPEGKARPGRDADHSPRSSADVKNE
jgi:hypothetical protein